VANVGIILFFISGRGWVLLKYKTLFVNPVNCEDNFDDMNFEFHFFLSLYYKSLQWNKKYDVMAATTVLVKSDILYG
jgi:hypothetical protein